MAMVASSRGEGHRQYGPGQSYDMADFNGHGMMASYPPTPTDPMAVPPPARPYHAPHLNIAPADRSPSVATPSYPTAMYDYNGVPMSPYGMPQHQQAQPQHPHHQQPHQPSPQHQQPPQHLNMGFNTGYVNAGPYMNTRNVTPAAVSDRDHAFSLPPHPQHHQAPAPVPHPHHSQQEPPSLQTAGPEPSPRRASPASPTKATLVSADQTVVDQQTKDLALKHGESVAFHTDVDTLMKAIQSKDDGDDVQLENDKTELPTKRETADSRAANKIKKKYKCSIAGCNKTFCQKTHLDIHTRAHTGYKPFVCKEVGCGQRFSQHGNLKTHERRHTGERPYHCDVCGKTFAQRGNVRAHKIVHEQVKPFSCRLDDCGKQFTQLGNLKSHQNKFHAATLRDLASKFASDEEAAKASPEDRALWEYFADLYKHSNKGIKGRGKDRRISSTRGSSGVQKNSHRRQQQQQQQQQHDSASATPTPTSAVGPSANSMRMPEPQSAVSDSPYVHEFDPNQQHHAAAHHSMPAQQGYHHPHHHQQHPMESAHGSPLSAHSEASFQTATEEQLHQQAQAHHQPLHIQTVHHPHAMPHSYAASPVDAKRGYMPHPSPTVSVGHSPVHQQLQQPHQLHTPMGAPPHGHMLPSPFPPPQLHLHTTMAPSVGGLTPISTPASATHPRPYGSMDMYNH